MSVVNLAEVMLWGIDDEDHVCTVYVVCICQRVNTWTLLEAILQLYLKYCKNGGIVSHKNG